MALGAQRIQVMRSMLSRPILLLFTGSCVGLIAGLLTAHVLAHLISLFLSLALATQLCCLEFSL